ncbi:MAG: flavodoxin family protein [Candidatus Methanomethylophilaceae archaeon]|jgi:multimeric flavodoxin WrbA
MKTMLIINGSPRKNGSNSVILKMLSEKASKFDYKPETIDICDLNINGCKACMACKTSGICAQKDDMLPLYDKILTADMLVIASPVYFGGETGQMKCFMDRFYAMVSNKDGKRIVNFGNVRKASIVLTCGAVDGQMRYGGILTRLMATMKSFNIIDVSGSIIPGASPDKIPEMDFVKDYLDSIEFQLEM